VPFFRPKVAILGPSTTQRNNAKLNNTVYNMSVGPHYWAQFLSDNFDLVNWQANGNSRGWDGYNFGYDSVGGVSSIDSQILLLPDIYASDADVLIWNTGRSTGDVYAGQTVAGYCDKVKTAMSQARAAGLFVVWENLWMRDTSVGGDWASGGAARTLTLQINAEMESWCNVNGFLWTDVYTEMTDPLSADHNPKTNYASPDGIHYSATGAFAVGDNVYRPFYALYFQPAVPYDPTLAGNLADNWQLSGTGGVATGNGASGVAPDLFTLTRSNAGNARSVVGSKIADTGFDWFRMTIGSSGTVTAAGEGASLRYTTTSIASKFTATKWYQAQITLRMSNWNGFCQAKAIATDTTATPVGSHSVCGSSGNGGDVPVDGFTATGQLPIRPGKAIEGVCKTQPFQAQATGMVLRFNASWINTTGGGTLDIAKLDIREVAAPSL
jgi:hypothetical protein